MGNIRPQRVLYTSIISSMFFMPTVFYTSPCWQGGNGLGVSDKASKNKCLASNQKKNQNGVEGGIFLLLVLRNGHILQ